MVPLYSLHSDSSGLRTGAGVSTEAGVSIETESVEDEKRTHMHRMWAAVAGSWGEHVDYTDARSAHEAELMLDLAAPRPGERVLELACGAGGLGLAAAARVGATGEVVLSVHNDGPEEHELIVVREGDHPLPFRKDGVTIDEDALAKAQVGGLEPGTPGSVRELQLRLTAGRYELFCNMSGHFLGGMHAQVVVS